MFEEKDEPCQRVWITRVDSSRSRHSRVVTCRDVTMPALGGIKAAVRIRKVAPKTQILFLSQHDSIVLFAGVLATEAQGYVLKSEAFKP